MDFTKATNTLFVDDKDPSEAAIKVLPDLMKMKSQQISSHNN